jgi:ankyrin repeat protein
MFFLRMGCLGIVSCAIVSAGLVIVGWRPWGDLQLRRTSISPDGKYVVWVKAEPMLIAMPGQGSDAPGVMTLTDAAGKEINRKRIEMVQLADVQWAWDRVEVGAIPDTWPLPPIDNRNILLFSAAYTGKAADVKQLIAQGADIRFTTALGQTLLHAAAVGQNPAIVQQILQSQVAINAIDHIGQTALHLAAAGRGAIVEQLVTQGADLNLVDQRGRTALTIAAAYGNRGVVQTLLDRGADVNLTNSDESPLRAVIANVKSGQSKLILVQLLLDRGAKITPGLLNNAVDHQDIEIVRLLLDRGADINARVPVNDSTLLIEVIQRQNLSPSVRQRLIKLFLARGADVKAQTRTGETALSAATKAGLAEVVALLKQQGANH